MMISHAPSFSADRAARSIIGCWYDNIVCLSVCL